MREISCKMDDLYICGNFVNIKSLLLCARQLRMEISTYAIIKHIVLNNINKSKSLKIERIQMIQKNATATLIIPSVSIPTQVRNCKVVLEDISFSYWCCKAPDAGSHSR